MELTYYSFNYNAPAMIRLRPEDGDDMIYNTNYEKFKDKKRYHRGRCKFIILVNYKINIICSKDFNSCFECRH